jgi:hypothetical protein
MIYRGQGFLAVISLSQFSRVSPVEFTNRRGEGEGIGEEPNHAREKAWPSINHSILPDINPFLIWDP